MKYIPTLLLVAASIIALVASTYHLSESPVIWYDEGFYSQIAMNVSELGRQVIQEAPSQYVSTSYITVGYPLTLPLSISYKLFGAHVLSGRVVMVLFLLGLCLVSYVLSKRLFGPLVAGFSALLLATFPMLYGIGKSVLGEVPGLFYLACTLLALVYLERSSYKNWRWFIVVGLSAGLCAATKPSFILLIIALGLVFILRFKEVTRSWVHVFAGFVALALPLILWVYVQFGAGVPIQELLSNYSNPYHVDNILSLIFKNLKRFGTESTPMYAAGMFVVWTVSLWFRRTSEKVSSSELVAFVFVLLTLLSYVRLEGWYRYLFPALVVEIIFFPYACVFLYKMIQKYVSMSLFVSFVPYALLLLLASLQLYQTARTSYVAQYYSSTNTQDLSVALSALSTTTSVFLYNAPEVAILLPSRNYYQYLYPTTQIHIGEKQLALLRGGTIDRVVVGRDIYQQNRKEFTRYGLAEEVGRYEMLSKK